MEKFLNLPEEKQKKIIDAAFKCFSANGYKKASVSDIAAAAGISKAMVFHYFGTKKELYFYLIELCGSIIMKEMEEKFDPAVTDFFDRIRLSSRIEMAVMKRHPALLAFITSAYFENDEEVREDKKAIFARGDDYRNKIAFDGMDYSKFKEGIDLKLFVKMLMWLAEGYTNQIPLNEDADFDALFAEFDQCLDMLKNNFYKEELVNKN